MLARKFREFSAFTTALLGFNSSRPSALCALEEVAADWSTAARFSLDAKEEFVEYVKVCPPALEAIIQSNSVLRQRALNSTIPVDHIDECLKLLGISDDACIVGEDDPEFEGSALKIKILKAHKEALDATACCVEIFHAASTVYAANSPQSSNREIVWIAGSTLSDCRENLKRRQIRCLDRLEKLYAKVGEEMLEVGVDPSTLPSLQNEIFLRSRSSVKRQR